MSKLKYMYDDISATYAEFRLLKSEILLEVTKKENKSLMGYENNPDIELATKCKRFFSLPYNIISKYKTYFNILFEIPDVKNDFPFNNKFFRDNYDTINCHLRNEIENFYDLFNFDEISSDETDLDRYFFIYFLDRKQNCLDIRNNDIHSLCWFNFKIIDKLFFDVVTLETENNKILEKYPVVTIIHKFFNFIENIHEKFEELAEKITNIIDIMKEYTGEYICICIGKKDNNHKEFFMKIKLECKFDGNFKKYTYIHNYKYCNIDIINECFKTFIIELPFRLDYVNYEGYEINDKCFSFNCQDINSFLQEIYVLMNNNRYLDHVITKEYKHIYKDPIKYNNSDYDTHNEIYDYIFENMYNNKKIIIDENSDMMRNYRKKIYKIQQNPFIFKNKIITSIETMCNLLEKECDDFLDLMIKSVQYVNKDQIEKLFDIMKSIIIEKHIKIKHVNFRTLYVLEKWLEEGSEILGLLQKYDLIGDINGLLKDIFNNYDDKYYKYFIKSLTEKSLSNLNENNFLVNHVFLNKLYNDCEEIIKSIKNIIIDHTCNDSLKKRRNSEKNTYINKIKMIKNFIEKIEHRICSINKDIFNNIKSLLNNF